MAILNRPSHGQPSVLLALWRTLAVCGSTERRELVELCTPPTASPDSGQVRKTLNTAVALGVFRESGDTLTLSQELDGAINDPSEDPLFRSFRRIVTDAAMAEGNNEGLGQPGEEGGRGAADFTYATCWMFEQDPLMVWTYDHVEQLQARDFPEGIRRPFQNDTRWPGFVDWLTFFGLGWTAKVAGGGLIVGPTPAITWQLPRLFPDGDTLAANDFLARLADAVPVLDGGTHRTSCARQFPDRYSRDANTLSPSLSFALARLEVSGAIGLMHRDDAPTAVLLAPQERSVTHVRMVGLDDG